MQTSQNDLIGDLIETFKILTDIEKVDKEQFFWI